MVEAIVAAVLIVALGWFMRETQWRERLSGERRTTSEFVKLSANFANKVDEVEEHAAQERSAWGQERRRLETRFDTRVNELIRQNQNLVERLASLRLADGVTTEGGEEQHLDATPEVVPFSTALDGFLSGIENSDARQMVEERVHYMRDVQNFSDEQILEELRRE